MKVSLVTEYICDIGGAEHDLANMAAIFPRSKIYSILHNSHKYSHINARRIYESSFGQKIPRYIKERRRLFLPLYPSIIEDMDIDDSPIVISLSHSFAKGIILQPGQKHICYCFSPTRYLWDWGSRYLMESPIPKIMKGTARRQFYKLRQWDYYAAQKVDHFIAISRVVQRRIKKYYNRNSKVIYPGVDLSKFEATAKNKGYWLMVGQMSAYKNFEVVIKAFNSIKKKLHVVGTGDQAKHLRKIANTNIKFLGRISDRDLIRQYQDAVAIVVPSNEDFGLVSVEAMASGKPVLALNKGGALEVVQEQINGVFFENSEDISNVIHGVHTIHKNHQNYDPNIIRRSVEKFSLDNFNKEIIKYVSKINRLEFLG